MFPIWAGWGGRADVDDVQYNDIWLLRSGWGLMEPPTPKEPQHERDKNRYKGNIESVCVPYHTQQTRIGAHFLCIEAVH